jgi:CheY-like chemotaxis protein
LALQGNLEDLPLLDIIQIVSFSKKTGYLHVRMEGGDGAIVFRDGLVVSAFTANSPAPDPRLATLPRGARDTAVKRRLGFALDELARLREGAFGFELTDSVPSLVGERDIRLETLTAGINPQEMLLSLAEGMDDERVQSAAAVEASFAVPAEDVVAGELAALAPPVVPSEAVHSALAGEAPVEDVLGGATIESAPLGGDALMAEALVEQTLPAAAEPPPGETAPADELGGATSAFEPADWPAPHAVKYTTDTRPLPKLSRDEVAPRHSPDDTLAPAMRQEPVQAPEAGAPAPEPAEAQAATAVPPPAAEAAPAPPPAAAAASAEPAAALARTILLVDDEEDVRGVLGKLFAAAGFEIVEAGDPEEAAKAAGKLRTDERPFVLVTDLGMPASGGASFQGGFEVVKRLWKMNLRPPVLMMTESLSPSLRLRARQMGVQSFVFKPTLSKLNPRQFEADLTAFAGKLARDVLPHLAEVAVLKKPPAKPQPRRPEARAEEAEPAAEGSARPFEFLKRRLVELREGGDANEIATLVMKVAREFFERALLFVVKNDEARGLGGFGLAPRDETLNLLARQLTIPLTEPSLFGQVAHERRPWSGVPPSDRWLGHVLGRVGRFQSRGIALLPLVAHRETIALVFGDNPETGRDPGGLEPLEVFVEQAGIALENVFLQKKLQAAEDTRTGRL